MGDDELMQYIILLLKGKATREQGAEVYRWLQESEENRMVYRQVAELYYKLNQANHWEKIDIEKARNHVKGVIRRNSGKRFLGYRLGGIAALVVVCAGIALLFQKKENDIPQPLALVEEVKAGEMKAMLTLGDGKKVELPGAGQVNVDLGFAHAVEDSLSGLVYEFNDSVVTPHEYHTLTVPRAGEYIMVLSDGSRVWLNSETELKYPVVFDEDKREVFLTGEAYFEVTKDVTRPFVVITPQTQTTVLGTSFNVMAYQGEVQTEVTLVEGAVKVKAGKRECQIIPGQQVTVDNGSLEMAQQQINVSFYTSWKDGLFDFDNMALSDLCVKLSRWYDVNFFFRNQAAAEKRFTGAIKRSRSLQFMLDFVQKTSGVRFEMKGKTVMVYNN